MFALILDKFYDGIYTEGSLNVDSFDKSLLFSMSFTMEDSTVLHLLDMYSLTVAFRTIS